MGFSRDQASNELEVRKRSAIVPIANNIIGLSLTGYDSSGSTTSDPNDIARIEVSIIARTQDTDPSTNRYRFYTTKTTVNLRN